MFMINSIMDEVDYFLLSITNLKLVNYCFQIVFDAADHQTHFNPLLQLNDRFSTQDKQNRYRKWFLIHSFDTDNNSQHYI